MKLTQYAQSSIGNKQIMAASGILLVLFLLVHLAGNLAMFVGPDAMNGYAATLKSYGPLLWVARIGLLVFFVTHIVSGFSTWSANQNARKTRYVAYRHQRTTWPARLMAATGLLLLVYVVFHLAHFTFGVVNPEHFAGQDAEGRHDVYRMVALGFQQPAMVAVYVLAMLGMSLHLAHAIPSFFQTLGVRHPTVVRAVRIGGPAIAVILFVGYASIPVFILTGVVSP